MLGEALGKSPGVVVHTFSWKRALLGRFDVFHAHWPEILVDGHSPAKKIVRQIFTLIFLVKLKTLSIPIVRTMHNLNLPDGITRRERWILGLIEKQTVYRINLNSTTPIEPNKPATVILHGHYRDWFAKYEPASVVKGQLGYAGLIRRYKGVEALVSAFHAAANPDLIRLRVGGKPSTEALTATLTSLAQGDPRIQFSFKFLQDAELVETLTSSELVVLPYRFMHNSGGVLSALSLNRPVLVPANEVNTRLAGEVGPGWLFTFTGDLTEKDLVDALLNSRAAASSRASMPDLSRREWTRVGAEHLEAYRAATAALSKSRSSSRMPQVKSPALKATIQGGPVKVTVAVLTYKRPGELMRNLPSTLAQMKQVEEQETRYTFELLVIDNDPAGSAGQALADLDSSVVRYVVESVPGIAAARNRALDEATEANLIVFIDDDEAPQPSWLHPLISAWESSRPAGVMGRVISEFQSPLDDWVAAGSFFKRRSMPTGTEIEVAAAGNLLLDLDQLRANGIRFPENLGLLGGEDTLLSRRIRQAGGRLVWCEESVATDFVPVERTSRRWVLTRSLSHGNSSSLIDAELATNAGQLAVVNLKNLLRGSARIVVGVTRSGYGFLTRSNKHQARGLRSAYRGLGIVIGAIGIGYQEYGRGERKFHRVERTSRRPASVGSSELRPPGGGSVKESW